VTVFVWVVVVVAQVRQGLVLVTGGAVTVVHSVLVRVYVEVLGT